MIEKANRTLRLQYAVGWLTVFLTAPLIVLAIKMAGYRVRNLKDIRAKARALIGQHRGPWLICANHLTLIDSVILAYAMFPFYQYLFAYRLLPWNVPEKTNFNRNAILTLLCFLLKCAPIVRGGERGSVKSTLDKCTYLLNRGENLLVFPEGTRSRSGRVDLENFQYGVGRLALRAQGCQVMCVYLRGDGQKTYSNFPKHKESFFMTMEVCRPCTDLKGLRAQREVARQIVNQLSDMENRYFETCGK